MIYTSAPFRPALAALSLFLWLSDPMSVVAQQTSPEDPNPLRDPFITPAGYVPPYIPEFIPTGRTETSRGGTITINGFDNFMAGEAGIDNFNMGTAFAEPHGSANPKNPKVYFNAFNTNTAYRTVNGQTWEVKTPPFPGFTVRGDPITCYDSLGRLYYMTMTGATSIVNCVVIRSSDNGQTWSSPVVAIQGVDKCWMAADQTAGPYSNNLYCVMTASPTDSSRITRSTDGGLSFQVVYKTPNVLPGMMVCIGANGEVQGGAVYVATTTGSSFAPTYNFFCSTDGGTTWTLKSSIPNTNYYVGSNVGGRHSVGNMRTRPYPMIAADNSYGPYRGRLYLVYATNEPAGNGQKPDIFLQHSDDQGSSWSPRVRVNDDATQNAHQFFPAIWCDKNTGRLYIKWYDSRNDAANLKMDVYATYTDDGGESFAPNQRITNQNFNINCTTCGGGGTPRYQGDYDAVSSSVPHTSMITWTDFRNGTFASFSSYFPDFALTSSVATAALRRTDSLNVLLKVPSTTLYTGTAKFSATVSPTPATGSIAFEFPAGDSLTAFPDSLTLRVRTLSVPDGVYTVKILGEGIDSVPAHTRTLTLNVLERASIALSPASLSFGGVQPNTDSTRLLRITNTGTLPLIIDSAITTNPKFTVEPDTATVAPGAFVDFAVTFNSAVQGSATGSLRLVHNAPGSPTLITLNAIALPVELTAFSARSDAGSVALSWQTASEQNNLGFEVERSYDAERFAKLGFVKGNGTTTEQKSYSYTDRSASGKVYYRLKQMDTDGKFTYSAALEVLASQPKTFAVEQNYPNPFNPATTISYAVPVAQQVSLKVYDVTGREVATLVNERKDAGRHSAAFNAARLASGIYFYRLQAGSFVETKKMLLVK